MQKENIISLSGTPRDLLRRKQPATEVARLLVERKIWLTFPFPCSQHQVSLRPPLANARLRQSCQNSDLSSLRCAR